MKTDYDEISILIIEDDEVDAAGIERAFNRLRVVNPLYRARNGVEGLNMLRGQNGAAPAVQRPYIILLDLNMPVMDGLEFLHRLRDDEHLQDSVVFVLTTSAADKDRSDAYSEHIAGYIVKSDLQSGFNRVIELLDAYWRVVVLPR